MRTFLFLALSAAVLAGLWFGLRPPVSESQVAGEPAGPSRFELRLSGGQVEGPEIFKVRQGDQVQIVVHSDSADELHLHGYDLTADLQPGQSATLNFTAERSGRFELELHGAHRGIGTLEVYPGL